MNIYLILWLVTMCAWLMQFIVTRDYYRKQVNYFRNLSHDYFNRWMEAMDKSHFTFDEDIKL